MAWSIPDDLPSASERWATPEFRTELEAWVGGEVGAVRQSEQVRLRPWSTVWRVDTAAGVFYAKQNCPMQGFEAALVAELQTIAPHRVVPAAAVDLDRGFLLTPDQGPVLWREGAPTAPGSWESLVVAASLLQREVSPHADHLVAQVGLTALPPERSGEQAADRIEALAALPEGDARRLVPAAAAGLRAHLPVVQGWGDHVAALGLPLTLQHNDLHEANAFDTPTGLRFFDFGDAVVAHPLSALLVPLNIAGYDLGEDPTDPRLRRIADAALEVWSDLVPVRALRAALPAALQLGRLGRVESWLRCTASMNAAERTEFGPHAATWLGTLIEDAPVRYDG